MAGSGGSAAGPGGSAAGRSTTGGGRRLLVVAANPSIDRLYEVDRLDPGAIHRPRTVIAVPGGKGLNAARAAAALGGHVTAAAILAGRAGDWIADGLAERGLDACVVRAGGETRTCISVLDRSTGDLTEVYEAGSAIDAATWDAFEAAILEELGRGDIAALTLSGSLPPGAPTEGFARLARVAAEASPATSVLADTYGPALKALLAEHPAVVKVNAAEAAGASGLEVTGARSAADAAQALRDLGAEAVMVTLGTGGAVVVDAGGASRLVPPDLVGPYPVGSGDAVLAGLAVAIARGDSLAGAARLGLAAGIANAQVPGAGELDPSAIAAILAGVTLGTV